MSQFKPLPYNVSETDREFAKILPGKKPQLNSDLTRNAQFQERTLEIFRQSLNHCKFNDFEKSNIVWNAGAYINVVSLDLKIVSKHIYNAETEWEKRYFARQAALLAYEGMNDLFDLFGTSLRKIIEELPNSDEIKEKRKSITKQLSEFKDKYKVRLDELRNFCIGHRDLNVLIQIDKICGISWTESVGFASAFDKILNNAGAFMQSLLETGYFDKKN